MEIGEGSRRGRGRPAGTASWKGGEEGGGGGEEWPIALTLSPKNFCQETLVVSHSYEFLKHILSKMSHGQQVLVESGYCMTILIHDVDTDEMHVTTMTKHDFSFALALAGEAQPALLPRKRKLDSTLSCSSGAAPVFCFCPVTSIQMSRNLSHGHVIGLRCPAASSRPLLEFKVLPSSSSILNLITDLDISEGEEKGDSN